MRFNFVGPSYTAQSPKFACELAQNIYCESAETPSGGKGGSRQMMVKIPGLAQWNVLPDEPLRGLFSGDGERAFAVSGSSAFEIFQDGSAAVLGALGDIDDNGLPAQLFFNGTQVFIVSGGKGYIADGVTVTKVLDSCCQGGYLDGYFLAVDGALPGDSKTFRISNFMNGLIWDVLDFANVEQNPDNIQALIVDHEQAIFLKQQTGIFYYDTGNPDFPIEPNNNTLIEQGCVAPFSLCKIDNTVMWLGGDSRGAGIVWRMEGATPRRVSNFAVENAIQGYVRAGKVISNANAYGVQDQGHTFYVLTIAGHTWVYDCATGLWHERGTWNLQTSQFDQHKAKFHCYAWGKHLVGGGAGTGIVYEQSISYQDDAGQPLRWVRRAPHIADAAGKNVYYSNLFLDFQVGVGIDSLLNPDGTPKNPTISLRYSNDGGNNWNPETQLELGKIGEYFYRVRQVMCGSGRDRVFEISGADPVQIAIVEADVEAVVGNS